MAQSDLRKVRRAVERLESALADRDVAIMAAADSGESYADIAVWARMSPQRVHQIVKKLKQQTP